MPGVPPDAANIVKRVFKGIFKRGKKNKQDGAESSTSTPPLQQQQNEPSSYPTESPTPQIDTKPPQLPPIGNASPLQGATEPSKDIPPTHPLSTGQHSERQEAMPVKKDGDPAPGPPMGAGAGVASTSATAPASGGLREPEKLGASNADVSPPVSAMEAADAPKSGAVSAISNEQPKTDGAGDGVAAAEPAKVEENTGKVGRLVDKKLKLTNEAFVTPLQPSTTTDNTNTAPIATETQTADPSPAVPKENIPPQTNGTAPTNPTTSSSSPTDTTTTAPATTDSTTTDTKPAPSDEKMPAVEEPPTIKTVRAAPGMSATSGPLEDFPEGGDTLKEH